MESYLNIQSQRSNSTLSPVPTPHCAPTHGVNVIPQWQQDETHRRLQLIKSGEMSTQDWEEAKKSIFEK